MWLGQAPRHKRKGSKRKKAPGDVVSHKRRRRDVLAIQDVVSSNIVASSNVAEPPDVAVSPDVVPSNGEFCESDSSGSEINDVTDVPDPREAELDDAQELSRPDSSGAESDGCRSEASEANFDSDGSSHGDCI